uniref:Uncharacterized protein n=1 Tax=Psilocybe cubensis TaxID=181762 RepID=A0A8H7XV97_PSICU
MVPAHLESSSHQTTFMATHSPDVPQLNALDLIPRVENLIFQCPANSVTRLVCKGLGSGSDFWCFNAFQAIIYSKAIRSSVDAAHVGFTICDDALALIKFMPHSTPEDRIAFLKGVKESTQQGYDKAVEAKLGFIHVRTTVEELLNKIKVEKDSTRDCGITEMQTLLSKGVQDLEQFSIILTKFAAWWNEMAMETSSQLRREKMLMQAFTNLQLTSLEQKWKEHRSRYAAYVNEISIVQDRYPGLFDESKPATFGEPQYAPPPGPPPGYAVQQQDKAIIARTETTETHSSDHWRFLPGLHRPKPIRSPTVIISEELSSTSYLSASLSTVQVLEPHRCLVILQFQCHPSPSRRFNALRIKWKLKSVRGVHPSKMIDVAPKYAIGAKNEESHHRKYSFSIPAQFSVGGFNTGPEVNAEWQVRKQLAHAMTITGSIRGHSQDSAEWSVEENASAMTGIPPHFCIAAVVQYEGIVMMELEVLAKQRGTGSWWSSRNQAKEDFVVDFDKARREFPEYKPSHNWTCWFPLITGEVAGGAVVHAQEAVTRN